MRYGVNILAVSDGRSLATDDACTLATQMLTGAGHFVLDTRTVKADAAAVQRAVSDASAVEGCNVVILIGAAGIDHGDVVPDALAAVATRSIPGFGDLFRLTRYRDVGAAAALTRASAGVVGPTVAFSLPGDRNAVDTALDELILPYIEDYVRAAHPSVGVPTLVPPLEPDNGVVDAEVEDVAEPEEDEEPTLPPPEPRWRLGTRSTVSPETEQLGRTPEAAIDAAGEDVPDRGWKRAVYDLEAAIVRGKSPDLPHNIEDFAPAMDVLHQAGETAQLKLPNGNKMMVYGYPDLQRASSKVLAVGWGEPFAEVVALHRYPVQAGLSIDEARGLMPTRDSDVGEVAEAVTGRAPTDTSGKLAAVDHDAVYIERGGRIYRWDGQRERNEGTIKQMLATLLVLWHQQ